MSIKDDVMSWSALFFKTAPDFSLPGQFSTLFAFICRYIFRSSHPSKYWPYWFSFSGSMSVRSWSLPIQPFRVTDLLEARNLAVLMRLDGFTKLGCLYQTLMCTGIQPGKALSKKLNVQAAVFQMRSGSGSVILQVLRAGDGFQVLCILYDFVVIEVQTCNTNSLISVSPVSLRWRWLFPRSQILRSRTLRIIYIIAEYGLRLFPVSAFSTAAFRRLFQTRVEEDVVAEHHGNGIIPDELLADDEGHNASPSGLAGTLWKAVHQTVWPSPSSALETRGCPAGWR